MTVRDRFTALGQWISLGSLVGVLCGGASALFLWLLERVTDFRNAHEAIVYTLPLAGLVIGAIYERFGASIKGGNNLVIDTIHDEGPEIPLRMAPMVLVGTVLTHLFGGSAGREGTAVQMGASLTDWVSHRLRVSRRSAAAARRGRGRRLRIGLRHADRGRGLRARVRRPRAHRVRRAGAGAGRVARRRPDDARAGHRPHALPDGGARTAHAAAACSSGSSSRPRSRP